jgi:protein-S-isoprenylcysteine O-methyltransferase Ste14
MRARTFWFLTLPALFVAETAGHTLVAQVLDPKDARHRLLSNALEDFALPFIALVVLLAAAILGRRVLASFRAEGPQPLPSWRLTALPVLGFIVQENAEQLVHEGRIDWLTALEPVVLLGLVLQLVWGLLAIWLVRTLLRAAEQLGWTLARRGTRWTRRSLRLRIRQFHAPEPRLPVLASQQAGRAPPAVA